MNRFARFLCGLLLGAAWFDQFLPRMQFLGPVMCPRRTAYETLRFNIDTPDNVPMTAQERAYTSPISYSP